MIASVRHVGIVVADLNTALHFYRDMLGLRFVKRTEESGEYIDTMLGTKNAAIITIKLRAPGDCMIELLHFKTHSHLEKREIFSQGISHIALTVRNIDESYSRLTAQGAVFNSPPQFSPDGAVKVCVCKDPEGNAIELVQEMQ